MGFRPFRVERAAKSRRAQEMRAGDEYNIKFMMHDYIKMVEMKKKKNELGCSEFKSDDGEGKKKL